MRIFVVNLHKTSYQFSLHVGGLRVAEIQIWLNFMQVCAPYMQKYKGVHFLLFSLVALYVRDGLPPVPMKLAVKIRCDDYIDMGELVLEF